MALTELGAAAVVACVTVDNLASVRVLEKAGLRRVGEPICLPGEDVPSVKYRLTKAQFDEILENYIRWREQFLDTSGELLLRFQPAPLVASFMRDPASTLREHIPVPKGPVEVW